MQIEAEEENHVFQQILSMHSPKYVILTWNVRRFGGFGLKSTEHQQTTSWMAEGMLKFSHNLKGLRKYLYPCLCTV